MPRAGGRSDASQPSYASGTSDTPLLGLTIGDLFDSVVASHGGRDAVVSVWQGIRWSYDRLADEVDRCARALLASGVQQGERVGIWAPNCAEWIVVQFATARIGAILVNVNPAYRGHELEYVLNRSGCALLVLAAGFRGADYVETLASIEAPALRESIVLGRDWDGFLARGDASAGEQLGGFELDPDDPINIQYTSGTTGFPKGATLTHHNILNNGYFVAELQGWTASDRVCLPVPFYHCFGMVMGTLGAVTHGSCIVIPSEGFDPLATLAAVEAERCTALYGVPTMFIAELEHPDFARFDVSSLRTGVMAGAPCPVEVMKRVQSELHMSEVTICYGMTETSPVSTQTRRDDTLEKQVSTVGTVHPHLEIKIVGPDSGRVVPRGETGELCTRGYSLMLGYWEDGEATAEAIDAAGWMHTGDLATMDDEGYVRIVGRSTDMIIRGGENVYPREVEEVLHTHADIADVAVVGVPDARYGEEVCAWIVLREGATLTEEDVRAYCRERAARAKMPRYVRFVDGFPLTVTGKVQKFKMRELEEAERGLGSAGRP